MIYTTPDFFPERPLNNPRFGYQNKFRDAIVVGSSQSGQNSADAMANGLTWDFWLPGNLPANATFSLPESVTFDYIGIAAHTLGTDGATITLSYLDGESWVQIEQITPTDDSPIILLFNPVESNSIRLDVSGSSIPAIGVLYAGMMLATERRIYQGHSPITMSARTTIRPQRSEGGQWLGRSIIRQGAETSISISNLTADWVRQHFKPFIRSAQRYPFFFAWRGEDFPSEVAYCWTSEDISPSNSGPRDLMSVSFAVDGIVGDDVDINETTE